MAALAFLFRLDARLDHFFAHRLRLSGKAFAIVAHCNVNGLGVGEKGVGGKASFLAAKKGDPLEIKISAAAFLNDEPIRARRISALGRLNRWRKRKPAVAYLTGAMALLLIAISIASTIAAARFQALANDKQKALVRETLAKNTAQAEKTAADKARRTRAACSAARRDTRSWTSRAPHWSRPRSGRTR